MNGVVGAAVALAIVGAATVGGVLFAFSAFVMSGLSRLRGAGGLRAMQSINVTAVTPPFMALFFGTGVLQVGLAFWALANPGAGDAGAGDPWAGSPWWIVSGGALYLIGTVGVTAVVHVPKNNALARVRDDDANAEAIWQSYQRTWTRWNHLRSAAALASAACLLVAFARSS